MKHHVSFDIELRKNPHKGVYIAFEGIDGSGKTTQVKNLKEYFEKEGKEVILAHEPTKDPPVGIMIHDFLKGRINLPQASLQYLFAADRAIYLKNVIEPALQKGKTVISDRSFWSSVAYGFLDKVEGDILLVSQSILSFYHQFIVPDMTFYINVSAENAIERLSKSKRQKEYYETREKLIKTREGYEWLTRKFPEEIIDINGEQSAGDVTSDIVKILNSQF